MLPPETMQATVLPPAVTGERGRQRERAGALGDDTHLLDQQPYGAAVSASETT